MKSREVFPFRKHFFKRILPSAIHAFIGGMSIQERFWFKKAKLSLAIKQELLYHYKRLFFGCIAQLVERSVHTRYVESSILPTATISLLTDPKGF